MLNSKDISFLKTNTAFNRFDKCKYKYGKLYKGYFGLSSSIFDTIKINHFDVIKNNYSLIKVNDTSFILHNNKYERLSFYYGDAHKIVREKYQQKNPTVSHPLKLEYLKKTIKNLYMDVNKIILQYQKKHQHNLGQQTTVIVEDLSVGKSTRLKSYMEKLSFALFYQSISEHLYVHYRLTYKQKTLVGNEILHKFDYLSEILFVLYVFGQINPKKYINEINCLQDIETVLQKKEYVDLSAYLYATIQPNKDTLLNY